MLISLAERRTRCRLFRLKIDGIPSKQVGANGKCDSSETRVNPLETPTPFSAMVLLVSLCSSRSQAQYRMAARAARAVSPASAANHSYGTGAREAGHRADLHQTTKRYGAHGCPSRREEAA